MCCIIGENNEINFIDRNNNKIIFDEEIFEELNFEIHGDNNVINIILDDESIIEQYFEQKFNIFIRGNNNLIELNLINIINIGYSSGISIGGYKNNELCDNSVIKIGNNCTLYGVNFHLKDNDSKILVGNNCLMSWNVYIWCTDGHTILNENNEIVNRGISIEIGNHVWVGKDVKICKNTKICDNSIVGWGSVVTKKFEKSNVAIAGNPARIIKENINWDERCISSYEKDSNG